MTEVSFSNLITKESTSYEAEETSLQKALSLSAILFRLPMEELQDDNEDKTVEEETLEDATEEGGMQYVGGFVARKFPRV